MTLTNPADLTECCCLLHLIPLGFPQLCLYPPGGDEPHSHTSLCLIVEALSCVPFQGHVYTSESMLTSFGCVQSYKLSVC